MTPVLHKLQGFYNLPEQKELPYLIEAVINDRKIVNTLLEAVPFIQHIFGPMRPRIETHAHYRCAKCSFGHIEVIVHIPTLRGEDETRQALLLFDQKLLEAGIRHEEVSFKPEYPQHHA